MSVTMRWVVITVVIIMLGAAGGVWGYWKGKQSLPESPAPVPVEGNASTVPAVNGGGRQVPPQAAPVTTGEKIPSEVFTGKLEKVDTGCFADGECYIEVGGKRVTALRGWSQETVGGVQGVAGFGDLESHLGQTVEVFAHQLPDGTYTLYGSADFYIKLPSGTGAQATTTASGGGCVVGGCSNQLCVEADASPAVSTCEYREEYACYARAECTRQVTGQCGFTETAELSQCLNKKSIGRPQIEVN